MNYFQDKQEQEQQGTQLSPLQQRLRQDEEDKRRRQKKSGNSKFSYFLTGLSGVLIGALIVWLLVMPSLANQATTSQNATTTTSQTSSNVSQNATVVTTDVTAAVEKVSDAVVGITNIQSAQVNFWSQSTTQETAGNGSGVIYKIAGDTAYIVTNHHVIEDAEELEVTLVDGTKEKAELVGSDIWTDLAVIAINSQNVKTVAQFGDSDVLKQGEPVIAIGNPLGLEFYGSVTTGVVSGTDRSVPVDLNGDGYEDWSTEVLQTDAAINPGNSGGALVNINGDLIGINSMKIAEATVEGLGFSIPINSAIPIIEELERNGEMRRPTMGVSLVDLTEVPAYYQRQQLALPEEVTTGVVVSQVVRGSAADTAGVEQYDVIVEMDGEKIENAIDLRKHLYNEKEIGDTLNMKVYRNGQIVELQLTLVDNTTL